MCIPADLYLSAQDGKGVQEVIWVIVAISVIVALFLGFEIGLLWLAAQVFKHF